MWSSFSVSHFPSPITSLLFLSDLTRTGSDVLVSWPIDYQRATRNVWLKFSSTKSKFTLCVSHKGSLIFLNSCYSTPDMIPGWCRHLISTKRGSNLKLWPSKNSNCRITPQKKKITVHDFSFAIARLSGYSSVCKCFVSDRRALICAADISMWYEMHLMVSTPKGHGLGECMSSCFSTSLYA